MDILITQTELIWNFLLKENEENLQGKGRKRAAPTGRGRGATTSSKRGKKSGTTSIQRMLMNKDDDDDDEDDMSKRLKKPQPRVSDIHLRMIFVIFSSLFPCQC